MLLRSRDVRGGGDDDDMLLGGGGDDDFFSRVACIGAAKPMR